MWIPLLSLAHILFLSAEASHEVPTVSHTDIASFLPKSDAHFSSLPYPFENDLNT